MESFAIATPCSPSAAWTQRCAQVSKRAKSQEVFTGTGRSTCPNWISLERWEARRSSGKASLSAFLRSRQSRSTSIPREVSSGRSTKVFTIVEPAPVTPEVSSPSASAVV